MTTGTLVDPSPSAALAISPTQTSWTDEQRTVLASLGIDKDVQPAELDLFLHEAQRTGLDPFSRQIVLIGRWSKKESRKVYRSQTTIDGFRVTAHRAAHRTSETISYDDTLWCGPDGKWRDVWLHKNPPSAAKITIYRGTAKISAVAIFTEYAVAQSSFWTSMPATMIAKCAEALALRKAFPNDLGGLYTSEEMGRADAEERTQPPALPTQRTSEPVVEDAEIVHKTYEQYVSDMLNATTAKQLHAIGDDLASNGIGLTDEDREALRRMWKARRDDMKAGKGPFDDWKAAIQ